MGRAGGGSGGRSSGGGGSRHSGGRSGGPSLGGGRSGRSGGNFSGGFGSSGGYNFGGSMFGGGRRPPRPPMPPRPPRPPRGPWGFWGMHGPYMPRRRVRNSIGCSGVLAIWILVLLLVIIVPILGSCANGFPWGRPQESGVDIGKSTIRREKLNSSTVKETAYYTDEAGWIYDASMLEKGMKHFYKKTGVQPHLYITERINGNGSPVSSELEEFGDDLYDRLFQDEAHLLVIFQEHEGIYHTWYVVGKEARLVMDDEACEILLDYLDAYYTASYDDEEYFSKCFADTADRIMSSTFSTWIIILPTAGGVVLIFIIYIWWKKRTRIAEQEEAEWEQDVLDKVNRDRKG